MLKWRIVNKSAADQLQEGLKLDVFDCVTCNAYHDYAFEVY